MSKLASRLFALLAVLAASAAFAQGYPAKPVRVLIGYGAGGVTDVIVRLVADDLGRRLGQPVIVENRTGAGGLIAARAVKAMSSTLGESFTIRGLLGRTALTWRVSSFNRPGFVPNVRPSFTFGHETFNSTAARQSMPLIAAQVST